MKKKLIQNLSANTLQLMVNQLFGVLMFYVLSVNLNKGSFGLINLALTAAFTAFNILSFGIDQTVVKKVANGDDARVVLSIYLFHVIFAGILFYGILLLSKGFFLNHELLYRLILFIGLGKLMIFFSTPLKQVSGGMEKFGLLAYMLASLWLNVFLCLGKRLFGESVVSKLLACHFYVLHILLFKPVVYHANKNR